MSSLNIYWEYKYINKSFVLRKWMKIFYPTSDILIPGFPIRLKVFSHGKTHTPFPFSLPFHGNSEYISTREEFGIEDDVFYVWLIWRKSFSARRRRKINRYVGIFKWWICYTVIRWKIRVNWMYTWIDFTRWYYTEKINTVWYWK